MIGEKIGYPSIDKPWLKYYSDAAINAKLPETCVWESIYLSNKDRPSDTAIVYFENKITYGELFVNIDRCVSSLINYGLKRGDVISLCTAGTPESVYLMLAANKMGVMANFINPLFSLEQMIDRINDTECKLLFVMDKFYGSVQDKLKLESVEKIIVMPVLGSASMKYRLLGKLKPIKVNYKNDSVISWSEFKKNSVEKRTCEVLYEKDYPAIMVYSSGSTGASKGIVLTNDGINATISYYTIDFEYERGDSFLQMVPIWFSTGNVLSILMPLRLGMKVILEPIFGEEAFVKDLIKLKPNLTLVPTGIWIKAMIDKRSAHIDLSGMKYPITGGEQILADTEEKLNAFFKSKGCQSRLYKGYGMCELGGTITSNSSIHTKLGSVGYPILGKVTVSAFDVNTDEEMKYNQRGELRVLSPARMKEYFKNPDETNKFFREGKDGQLWACTGDIGYVDEDGDVFVLGRATDSYMSKNGELVYLFDIENVIKKNKNVEVCKVVDVDENGTISPVAHMILKENIADTEAFIKDIYEMCKSNLKDSEVPLKYKIRDSFPVHANGKRDVGALRLDREGMIEI